MEILGTFLLRVITLPYTIYNWLYSTFCTLNVSKIGPVFVTGCDSGFGHLLALRLVQNGINAFAGCLTEAGENELKKAAGQSPGKLWTLTLDVTNQSAVDKAVNYVKKSLGHGKGIWALVNNAGISGSFAADDWLTVNDYQKALDVNFLGVVRVTHAFKSLLKLERGRVVVITSVFGRVATTGGGPYIASKFAAEAYCDVIRRELRPFGVSVHILEPGFFATSITNPDTLSKSFTQTWHRLPSDVKEEYGDEYFKSGLSAIQTQIPSLCSNRLNLVIDAYYDALTSRFPSLRYHVGADAKYFFIPLSLLPTSSQDFVLYVFGRLQGVPVPKHAIVGNKGNK